MFAKGGAEAVREQNVSEDDEREQGGVSSIVSSSEGVPGGSCSGSRIYITFAFCRFPEKIQTLEAAMEVELVDALWDRSNQTHWALVMMDQEKEGMNKSF